MHLVLRKKNSLRLKVREVELVSTPFLLHTHDTQREGACKHTCVHQTLSAGLLQ